MMILGARLGEMSIVSRRSANGISRWRKRRDAHSSAKAWLTYKCRLLPHFSFSSFLRATQARQLAMMTEDQDTVDKTLEQLMAEARHHHEKMEYHQAKTQSDQKKTQYHHAKMGEVLQLVAGTLYSFMMD